jgi:hypothetical protein
MRLPTIPLIGLLALSSAPAFAQEDEDIPPPPPPPAAEEKKEEEAKKEEPAAAATDEAQKTAFTIRRGFFAEGDLGIFVTIGGVNTNSVELNNRSTSNLQPYIGATFGYDVVDLEAFAMGLGLRFAMGLNGGAGRANPGDPDPNTQSNDYSIQEAGAVLNFVFMVADRVGLTLKLHGGAGFVTPDPTLPAGEPDAGKFVFAPVFGGQFGVELYTLLNDFSIGIQAGFVGAIAAGEFIPGLSGTIPIKYTF